MRKTRIFVDQELQVGAELILAKQAAHHIDHVLRLKPGNFLILFNGCGGEYVAELSRVDKRGVGVRINQYLEIDRESSLPIILAQGVSRGQKMDFTLQKSVELGVIRIVPVMTQYGNIRFDEKRLQKKIEHWHKIIISACEQCGRNKVPELVAPVTLDDWLVLESEATKIVLHPGSENNLSKLSKPDEEVILLAGSEGGFSDHEIKKACGMGYQNINIGPRVLRTETAALAAISACQTLWGDFVQM